MILKEKRTNSKHKLDYFFIHLRDTRELSMLKSDKSSRHTLRNDALIIYSILLASGVNSLITRTPIKCCVGAVGTVVCAVLKKEI